MAVTDDYIKVYDEGQEIFRRRSVGTLVTEIRMQRIQLAAERAINAEMLEALKAIMEWDTSDMVELRAIKAEKILPAIAKAEVSNG